MKPHDYKQIFSVMSEPMAMRQTVLGLLKGILLEWGGKEGQPMPPDSTVLWYARIVMQAYLDRRAEIVREEIARKGAKAS